MSPTAPDERLFHRFFDARQCSMVECFGHRRDGRVDEGGGLENRCGFRPTGGSNPSPSA
jgi:hypothetical protein